MHGHSLEKLTKTKIGLVGAKVNCLEEDTVVIMEILNYLGNWLDIGSNENLNMIIFLEIWYLFLTIY